jgi:AcrR family transcriptional regulator
MNKSVGRPKGRRSGDPETRARILHAARDRLLAQGYAGTTLRAVAADAGVDVALISYYFGSKQGLFSAVMALVVSPPTVLGAALEGDPARLPERLVAAVTAAWDDPVSRGPLRALITAALQEPAGQRALVEFLEREVIARLAERLGGPRATARAAAAATTIVGLIFTRHLLGLPSIAGASRVQLVHDLAPAIRTSLSGPHRR